MFETSNLSVETCFLIDINTKNKAPLIHLQYLIFLVFPGTYVFFRCILLSTIKSLILSKCAYETLLSYSAIPPEPNDFNKTLNEIKIELYELFFKSLHY